MDFCSEVVALEDMELVGFDKDRVGSDKLHRHRQEGEEEGEGNCKDSWNRTRPLDCFHKCRTDFPGKGQQLVLLAGRYTCTLDFYNLRCKHSLERCNSPSPTSVAEALTYPSRYSTLDILVDAHFSYAKKENLSEACAELSVLRLNRNERIVL